MIYCNYCPGYCCYRLEGSILFVDNDDINRLARYFQISDGEVRKRYMENKNTFKVKDDDSCIFQSSEKMVRRCTIHQVRPSQCRRFPYTDACPYLEREDLLAAIQPRIEKNSWTNPLTNRSLKSPELHQCSPTRKAAVILPR